MAALTVQGGLVKNKMKGGSLYQTKPTRPPPLTCFFSIETPLFRQATFYLAELFRQATFYLAELSRQIPFLDLGWNTIACRLWPHRAMDT